MIRKMKETAEGLGLPFGDGLMTYNSRLAQELGLWAQSRGKGHAFHDAAFRAYFADGKNIAKRPVLLDLTESAGLPRNEAEEVIQDRQFKEAVDADWALSREKEIVAIPTFVLNSDRLVGAQSYKKMTAMIEENGVRRSR